MSKLFMSTLPKSGTHFLVQFFNAVGLKRHPVGDDIYRILNNFRYLYEISDDLIRVKRNEMEILRDQNVSTKEDFFERLDFFRNQTLQKILELPEGHFVYNHYAYDPNLIGKIHNAGIPVIFLYRDPRDYVVSFCNHIVRHPEHKHHHRFKNMGSDDERYSALIKGQNGLYGITPLTVAFRPMMGWIHDPRVFTMRFEEIIGPKGLGSRYVQYRSFERLMNHMDLPISREELYDCIDLSYNEKHTLFVKGQIGQWNTVFSGEVLDEFHTHAGALLDELGYNEIDFAQSGLKGLNDDVERLMKCLEHAEKNLLAERREAASMREHIKKLTNTVAHIEADSVKRLELIFKHEARIRELEAALKRRA